MPRTRKQELFNTRELITSDDLNRLQQIANQNQIQAGINQTRNVWGNTIGVSEFERTPLLGPFSYISKSFTVIQDNAAMGLTFGAGEVVEYAAAVDADDPEGIVHNWAQTTVTPAVGDGSNPRIDLIISTVAEVQSDPEARTILVDPVTRATALNSVNKTTTQTATLSVVAGTPAAVPVAPAVPVGSFAIAALYVPASVTRADYCGLILKVERPAIEVQAPPHGIITGGNFSYLGEADVSSPATLDMGWHPWTVAINGEVLRGAPGADTGLSNFLQIDTGANPFSGTSANADLPFFLYIVGGSLSPQIARNNRTSRTDIAVPWIVVQTLRVPSADGHASGDLTVGGNNIPAAACLYIGIGYKSLGTTDIKPVTNRDGWVWSGGSPVSPGSGIFPDASRIFNEIDGGNPGGERTGPAISTTTAYSFLTAPAVPFSFPVGNRAAKIWFMMRYSANCDFRLRERRALGSSDPAFWQSSANGTASDPQIQQDFVYELTLDAPNGFIIERGPNSDANPIGGFFYFNACAAAYKTNVFRLGGI